MSLPGLRRALLALLLAASPVAVRASDGRAVLPGPELREVLSGNTVTGRHDNGMPYSEFHAPDGRVLGHNNREAVDKGCWDIRGDEVCYYYAGGNVQGEFCWTFRRVSANGFRLELPRTGTLAIGLLQPGNPHGHSDNGKPWVCTPLVSERPYTPRLAGR
jgi:hypothetical protein